MTSIDLYWLNDVVLLYGSWFPVGRQPWWASPLSGNMPFGE